MIRRRRKTREIEFSFDSFLDVVANVVGIILRLILIAWVGARSYHVAVPSPPSLTAEEIAEIPDPNDPLSAELEKQRKELAQSQAQLLEQLKDWQKLRQDSTVTAEDLSHLTAQVQSIDSERKNLEGKAQKDTQSMRDAALSLAEIRERSQRVIKEIEELRKAPPCKQTLRYRTPVSQDVHAEEFEFECRNGRVTFIEVAAFKAEIQQEMRDQGGKTLNDIGHYAGVTPPIGAFRMHFTLDKDSVTSQIETFSELEPMTFDRGETLERALAPGSEFRRYIDNIEPKFTAVTLWVYSDSFPLYRKLRDYMDERGIMVAGRPMSPGAHISYGSRGKVSRGQ